MSINSTVVGVDDKSDNNNGIDEEAKEFVAIVVLCSLHLLVFSCCRVVVC